MSPSSLASTSNYHVNDNENGMDTTTGNPKRSSLDDQTMIQEDDNMLINQLDYQDYKYSNINNNFNINNNSSCRRRSVLPPTTTVTTNQEEEERILSQAPPTDGAHQSQTSSSSSSSCFPSSTSTINTFTSSSALLFFIMNDSSNINNSTSSMKGQPTRSLMCGMLSPYYIMLCFMFGLVLVCCCGVSNTLAGNPAEVFTNTFHVRFKRDVDHQLAHHIAKRHGFINLGPILGSTRDYHFQHRALPHARNKRSIGHYRQLKSDHMIESAQQQLGFRRQKRGYKSLSALDELVENLPKQKDPDDPFFQYQWYLKNVGQNGGKPRLDLNVEAAWAQGITGKNVTTAIMDDGVDYMHPDLKDNYNAKASYDFSSNDPYPYPRYTDDWFNSHGTRCAGEVAAKRDNGICGVGVAYDSKVAGIRMLDQPYMTDLIEANSMGHEPDLIDIYSASWGPTDDGKTVDGPRNATMRAIVRGVNEGRRGLGNIYVWASGDGGEDDDCNCDGYAASMWTISINSAINDGQNAHYDESCSSTLASTFSNGAKDPHTGVATTDLYGRCTKTHSGTSAAAPEAAGVFALALEANPNLTWRDVQHLCVLTSKRNSLYDSKKRFYWNMNGVGLEFNHLFGYGVLDAGAMVALSKQWKTVPPRYHCEAGSIQDDHLSIPNNKSILLKIDTKACAGTETEVNYIEHVQAVITLNSTRRGDVVLYLISPMGTKSMILSRRPNDDDSHDGFVKWPFMTTHTWGENPRGQWRLEAQHSGPEPQTGFIKEWILMIHGTKEQPYKDLPVDDNNSKLAIVKKAHEDAYKKNK